MIPDRNLELHERMKNIKDDEYVVSIRFFSLFAIKNTTYFGVNSICRNKI